MMRVLSNKLLLLLLALQLFACGGGDSDDSPGSASDKKTPPSGSILFPPDYSGISDSTLTVRGVAHGESGVDEVRVNGEVARLTRPLSGLDRGWAWEVRVPIPAGKSRLVLEVQDASGALNSEVDEVLVSRLAVPDHFQFDPVNRRLIGVSDDLLIDHDIATGALTLDELAHQYAPQFVCHRSDSDELISVRIEESSERTYVFEHRGLSDDAASSVIHVEAGLSNSASVLGLVCDQQRDRVYLAVNVSPENYNDPTRSYIYTLDYTDPDGIIWEVLYETEDPTSNRDLITDVVMMQDALLLHSRVDGGRLEAVSVDDGSMEVLKSSYDPFGLRLVSGSTRARVLVVHYGGVEIFDAERGTPVLISEEPEKDFKFTGIGGVALDEEAGRLLVADTGRQIVMGIDLATGKRSTVLASGVGEGPRLSSLRRMAFTADGTEVYVVDAGGGRADPKVVRVDTRTGDRSSVGELPEDSYGSIRYIALDEEANRVYVGLGNEIYQINLLDDSTRLIPVGQPDEEVGSFYITSIAIDKRHNRLLFIGGYLNSGSDGADTKESEALYAIDLDSYERNVVSQEGVRGGGPGIVRVAGMVLDAEGRIYLADQGREAIISVNPETGGRREIAIDCVEFWPHELELMEGIALDEKHNRFVILGNSMVYMDREEGYCFRSDAPLYPVIDAEVTSDGDIFALGFDGLYFVDYETGQKVLVSQ